VVGKVKTPENMTNMIENGGKYDKCNKGLMAKRALFILKLKSLKNVIIWWLLLSNSRVIYIILTNTFM